MAQPLLPQQGPLAEALPRLAWLGLGMSRTSHCQHSPGVHCGDLEVGYPWPRAVLVQGAGRVRALAVAWEAVCA